MQLPLPIWSLYFQDFCFFTPCPHNIVAFLVNGKVSILYVCIGHSIPFSKKTQNFLSPTKMAKVLFEKKYFKWLWKIKEKISKIYKVWKRFVKRKKIQNPPERIKIASKEKYFQSPSFESKKKNSKLLLLPWKKYFSRFSSFNSYSRS